MYINKKNPNIYLLGVWISFLLFYKDSNLEFQDQNLTCYHYTIEQFVFF